jgi:hypothetical protein
LELGLSKRRITGQKMEVNTMEEVEINNVIEEEVVMEDTDYAKLKNKVMKPKKRIAGESGPEFSSDEDLRAQFCNSSAMLTNVVNLAT